MSSLAEILSTYQLFVGGEDLIECSTDESQGKQVPDAAICEYLYLKLDGEKIPYGGRECYVDFTDSADMQAIG